MKNTKYTQINKKNLGYAQWNAPSVTKPNPENCNCLWLCTTVIYSTTQNSSDNLPSYLQTHTIAQMLSIRGEVALFCTQITVGWLGLQLGCVKYCYTEHIIHDDFCITLHCIDTTFFLSFWVGWGIYTGWTTINCQSRQQVVFSNGRKRRFLWQ